MPIVSVTRLRVRSLRYMLPFIVFSLRSAWQAKRAKGNLRTALLNDANQAFWTCTVWTTEEAMKSFMLSGAHRKAMPRLLDWCDEAALVHWSQASDQKPDWQEAHQRLQEEGRRSKVRHPSPAQDKYEIPKPRDS